jgi:hypothetical protein
MTAPRGWPNLAGTVVRREEHGDGEGSETGFGCGTHSDDASTLRSIPKINSSLDAAGRPAPGATGSGALTGRIVTWVWRYALSRRWWAGHVLIIAGCGLFLALAYWQWDRAHSVTGDWQNLGYALQWPLFAVFLVAAWLRFLWLERHALDQHGGPDGTLPHAVSRSREVSAIPARASPPADRSTPEDEPDDELAAYNAYLARLAAEDRRS